MRFGAAAVLTTTAVFSSQLAAQQATPPAAPAAPATPGFDFSGIMFGNYQYRTDSAAKAQTGGKSPNKFEMDRIYLTFRMPAGDKTSIRVTTDIFQNTATGYYGGWVVRIKYGYVQRELTKKLFGVDGMTAVARVGSLHTVVIDQMEVFWPRWLGTVGTERNGFFSSADIGAATLVTLPNKRGEVYVTAMNGPGYAAAENDRFKDIAARATLTPFANRSGLIKGVAITPWYSKGASASAFINGGAGQVGRVSEGVQKDRRGLLVGLKDRRLTASTEFSQRAEEVEGGANTAGNPRTVTSRTSNLKSIFASVRPMEWIKNDTQSRWGVLTRVEKFELDNSANPATQFSVIGAYWDFSSKAQLILNVQELKALGGSTTIPLKTLFVHWKTDF